MAVIDWDLYKKDANYRSKIINQLAEEQKKTDVSGTPVASYQTQLDKADARAVEKKQADEKVHKQFDSKSWGEFAGWQAAGAAGALGFAYGLPWLSSNILPYTTARGIYGLTQAAGTTPYWFTPQLATAADAALVGIGTGASINDMRENGPTVGNVLGTALGVGGLAYEAAPTIMEGYIAARNAVRPTIIGMRMHTMPLGEVETPTLTPQMRYRLGDVEINDPNLNYRQGARGTADDFLKSGKVRVKYEGADAAKREKKPGRFLLTKSFNNPMFKQGGLWYDSWVMDEPGAVPGMPDLLVTRQPLRFATKGAGPAKADLGGRRIPFSADQLNLENTQAYSWENGYGFRRRTPGMPRTKYPFSEHPSTLTDAERAGIPRGERNNNPSPDYTQNILSMFPKHDASYIHTGIRTPDTKSFAEYLQSVGVDAQRLSDLELQQLMRMRQQSITHPSGEYGIIDTSPWGSQIQMFDGSKNTGNLEFIMDRRNKTLGIARIHKEEDVPRGFSRKAYDMGIDYSGRIGLNGVVSGESLASPEQTYKVWEYYPTRQIIKDTGHHTFNSGRDVDKIGSTYSIDSGPVVLLSEPSAPVLPYKHLSFFHPAMIKNGTLQAPKWNVNSPFFSKGGKLKNEKH